MSMTLFACPLNYVCGPAALLLVLRHYDPTRVVSKREVFRIWQRTATLPIRGASVFALAREAQRAGISTRVIVEDRAYRFPNYERWGYSEADIEMAAYMDALHQRDALDSGVEIEERALHPDEIISIAHGGEPLIVRLDSGRLDPDEMDRPRAHLAVLHHEPGVEREQPYALYDPFRNRVFRLGRDRLAGAIDAVRTRCGRDRRAIEFKTRE